MKKISHITTALLAFTLLHATAAHAAKKVYSPGVEQGEWELEHYGSYGFEHEDGSDDYEYKSKTAIGYGLTDWWKFELEAIAKNVPGNNLEYYATEFVNKFEFWEQGEIPFSMGVYTAYETHRDDSKADKLELKFLFKKELEESEHKFNLIVERGIGSKRGPGVEWGVAWASMWEMQGHWELGFEYYGEFGELHNMHSYGEQSHQIGPVVEFEIPGTELEAKLGYLAGISSAAFDSTIKWELEWEF
ncbi:MAG: hypothetical protein MRY32_09670 [Rickettsiales bacterium]|nr:hypothetical protein [Rickettsiales bacterium]